MEQSNRVFHCWRGNCSGRDLYSVPETKTLRTVFCFRRGNTRDSFHPCAVGNFVCNSELRPWSVPSPTPGAVLFGVDRWEEYCPIPVGSVRQLRHDLHRLRVLPRSPDSDSFGSRLLDKHSPGTLAQKVLRRCCSSRSRLAGFFFSKVQVQR